MKSASYRELLKGNKNFRRLWFGQVISELGTWFSFIAELGLVRLLSGSALMTTALLVALLTAVLPAAAQPVNPKSGLPNPPKPDTPYLIHASILLETERNEAKEETRRDDQLYYVPGTTSGVKTPLAGPEFLFQSETVAPERLQLFKLEVRSGRREVVVARKKKPVAQPGRLSVFRLEPKLSKVRVDDSLTPGEYCLTPDGSNAIFGFTVE